MNQPLATAAILFALGAGSLATTFSKETTADLIVRAERVCCVRCEGVEARLDSRTGIVFTYVRARVLEDMVGSGSGSTLELRIVGGTASGVETRVAGMPRFVEGGECVLLLGKKNRAGFPVVLQAARGAIPLRKAKNGTRLLRSFVSGFSELRGPRVTLDAFRGAVKRTVQAHRARQEAAAKKAADEARKRKNR